MVNLLNKIHKVYLEESQFTDQNGKEVSYSRLKITLNIKGKEKILEFKPANLKIEDVETFFDLSTPKDEKFDLNED